MCPVLGSSITVCTWLPPSVAHYSCLAGGNRFAFGGRSLELFTKTRVGAQAQGKKGRNSGLAWSRRVPFEAVSSKDDSNPTDHPDRRDRATRAAGPMASTGRAADFAAGTKGVLVTSNRGETQYNSHDGISLGSATEAAARVPDPLILVIYTYISTMACGRRMGGFAPPEAPHSSKLPGSSATNQAFPDTHVWRDASSGR